jgi:hypothetical protein
MPRSVPPLLVRRSALVVWLAAAFALAARLDGATESPVDFSRDIRPILSGKCFHCHGADSEARKAKLRLDVREEAVRPRGNRAAIAPGQAPESELVRRILSSDPEEVMPPPKSGHAITREESTLLQKWIAQGAKYSGHWAFTKPVRPPLPVGSQGGHPIDRFISDRLASAGLALSPEADRSSLLRRVSLDLTGLPPTPEELADFEADQTPGAYARVVDRLLASPRFGERWARPWLDLARYADSSGLGSDPLRPNIWPYRDWLIDALNRNLAFDEFTRDQLAGDLVPEAGESQRVATAFHRNTMTNTEGGTDDEEWRVAAVKDRANVTVQAWMGLTLGCAQCHTHKFDPISHHEYYSLFAFFNQTADNDQPDERPTMPYLSAAERRERAALETRIAAAETRFREPNPDYDRELAAWTEKSAMPVSWTVLNPDVVSSVGTNGSVFQILPDGSVRAEGAGPERDSYRVQVRTTLQGITAFRLEALTDPTLPKQGPGRATGEGNFVLNDFRIEMVPTERRSLSARFVRIEAPGPDRILSLAEVQVFSGGRNLAGRGKAQQSSTGYLGDAGRAIDGNTDGDYDGARSTTHTGTESDPWWELDLEREEPVEELAIWNRTDGAGDRLAGTRVRLLDAGRRLVWEGPIASAPAPVFRTGPAAPQPLALRVASADHSQDGFSAAMAIDSDLGRKSGWAIGGALGQPHALVAELATPIGTNGPVILTFTLSHTYGDHQTLGRFRLSATTRPAPVRQFPTAVAAALAVPAPERTAGQRGVLVDYHRPTSTTMGPVSTEIASMKSALREIRGVPLPVMQEVVSSAHRVTRVMNKGNFLDPGERVEPGVLSAFHSLPEGAPTNRLGLAAWITSRENPLTARVAVNRTWSALFGTGIVETEEDLGTQGALPSHPELLDWLSVEFMSPSVTSERAWDFKRLLRLMVSSRTYTQSARVPEASAAKDPKNRLLSHFPRRRLDAEMVRDQALAVSGLLSAKMGGPSVYPTQPDGLWRAAFNGERSYSVSEGEDRYRRGVYTVWRRTAPNPSMSTFDAPSRETCTFRRQPTNTPLQAYVTLNDPTYVEAAQALARRLVREGGATPADRIRLGYRLVTGRKAGPRELAEFEHLFSDLRKEFSGKPAEAQRFATQPLGPLPAGSDPVEAAAWTAVANVLLNLDAVLTKG